MEQNTQGKRPLGAQNKMGRLSQKYVQSLGGGKNWK